MTMLDEATEPGPLALGSSEGLGCNAQAVARERPILFSAPMVRALLDGTKTQTRRAWPTQPPPGVPIGWVPGETSAGRYGKRGDRLWVRETWAAPHQYDGHQPAHIPALTRWHYAATEERGGLRWRPSIHMPRVASRMTLQITDVRVERLQAISRGDAMAEGCPFANMAAGPDPRAWYADLWDAINGAGAWDSNPWLWVVEFHRCPNLQPNV